MAPHTGYEKVQVHDDAESDDNVDLYSTPSPPKARRRLEYVLIAVLLLVSNVCTWYLSELRFRRPFAASSAGRSPYAGLEWDFPLTMHGETLFNHPNQTIRDAAWEGINIDSGMITLPQDFIKEKGLPDSQRFVWDRSRSVYLLNGYHSLHCARAVYIALNEFYHKKPQSRRWAHVMHCVDSLRQEALCNADDTPRYSDDTDIPVTGLHQMRMCRNWDKLEAWARQNTACYRYINQTSSYSEVPQVERFVWCPKGSPYIKEVEKVFGHIEWDENSFTISEPELV